MKLTSSMDFPTEIMQKIFLELCSPQTQFPLSYDPLEPRLVLTQVSSQWRTIALAMSELWNNIVFRLPSLEDESNEDEDDEEEDNEGEGNEGEDDESEDDEGEEVARLCDPIRIWLLRSHPSPFSFQTFISDPFIMHGLFNLIFPIAHRCSTLILDLDGEMLHRLVSLPSGLFNSLRDLRFTAWAASADDKILVAGLHETITTFQLCPQLLKVDFSFHATPIDITLFELPWAQLSDLIIEIPTISPTHCIYILRQTVCLQICDLSISPIDNLALQAIIPLSVHPISLPWLHTLSLCFSTPDHNSYFLAGLHLPSLRKLKPATTNGSLWSLSTFQSFFVDKLTTIQWLDLTEFTDFSHATETIALLPHIRILSFDITDSIPSETLRALGDGAIGAQLTRLLAGRMEPAELLDLLEARAVAARAVGSNITNFNFVSTSGDLSGPEESARVNVLVRAGMEIRIEEY